MQNNTERNIKKRLSIWAFVVALILLVPFLAMQLQMKVYDPGSGYEQIAWTLSDFVIIGALLFGTALTYELLARKMKNATHRAVLGIVLTAVLLLIWADLAVGIFNIPGISGS